MPALSLVVCLHQQRDLLERLLQKGAGCYDDLVVVHDGPDETGLRAIVEAAGGRFFERPRENQQERHWPFAWQQARHDWILRLDADEFPGEEMKVWLKQFRQAADPAADISGFTCIWPMWNGRRTVTKKWPAGHVFLFDRRRVRFFGMPEQGAIPDGRWEALDYVLQHQPKRKSYGLYNVLFRKQAHLWCNAIIQSLLGRPGDLPGWRWNKDDPWPPDWEQIRRHPLRTAFSRLVRGTLRGLRDQWKGERRIFPVAAINGPVFHVMMCLKFWRAHRQYLRDQAK